MQPHGGKEGLNPSRTLLSQRVTALEGLEQLRWESHTPNRLFRPDEAGASSPIERRAAALDPLFQTHFGRHFRRVFGTTPASFLRAQDGQSTFSEPSSVSRFEIGGVDVESLAVAEKRQVLSETY